MTSTDEWDLVTLKHGWSHINESIFTYDSCGNSLHAATGLTYKCGEFELFTLCTVNDISIKEQDSTNMAVTI